jgi:hypothetical protein
MEVFKTILKVITTLIPEDGGSAETCWILNKYLMKSAQFFFFFIFLH